MSESQVYQHYQTRNFIPFRLGRGSSPRPNDTPSPSRSPAPQSPGSFGMYSQPPQQAQGHPHMLMNAAGQPHTRYMQKNIAQAFQAQHQHHQPLHQPQQPSQLSDRVLAHPGANNSQNGLSGHQHTYSGGTIGGTGFTGQQQQQQQHLTNGVASSVQTNANVSGHWEKQLQLAQISRQSGSPHHQARVAATKTKTGVGAKGASTVLTTAEDNEDEGSNGANENEKRPIQQRKLTEKDKRQEWFALDFGGQGLRALAENLFNYTFLDKLYINHNQLKSLPSSIGKLKLLTYLDASSNQLTEIPAEIGMLTNLKTLLLFDNHIQNLPGEMGTLFQLEILGVEGNPLKENLRSKIATDGTSALINYLLESSQIELPDPAREWNVLDGSTLEGKPSTEGDPHKFSIISYNILCEKYATPQAYGYVPSWALAWDYRKSLISNDILSSNADIVCLQEVDLNNFEDYLSPTMAYQDYKGVIFQKTRARNFGAQETRQVDGCAIFWKTTKFNILDKQVINFQQLAINRPDMKKATDIFNRVMPRDDVATIIYLENKLTGGRMIVANAHLFWNPVFEDVKLIQTAVLMEELGKLANKYVANPPPSKIQKVEGQEEIPEVKYPNGASIPLVVCGDFNSLGDSGVYELITKGAIDAHHPTLGGRDYGPYSEEGISHPFNLKSAYSIFPDFPFTNYTPGFNGVIDYIWYSSNCMQVTGLLGEVDKEYMSKVAGFPNVHFPSDHLMIQAEFYMKPPRKEVQKPPPPDFGATSSRK
ncbi:Glucose-repressible alcohol dehydrogenase transcriptional effector, variant 2 [Orbilia oligospora]|nr:Glucose-repressible alcohol dehydrogenase transcriptional effector [Orbilia oligospora]KAF3308274.1 Glucose-repressible alcohol dehydrogenase transcriptional effector, variant 2 [Orbilia oligospora]